MSGRERRIPSKRRTSVMVSGIEAETDRLTLIVSNLLDHSRIEDGALKSQRDCITFDDAVPPDSPPRWSAPNRDQRVTRTPAFPQYPLGWEEVIIRRR